MYNRHLDTFLKVAQLGSFSAAAEALYITPSAVIQQINALEHELNAVLFLRSRRGVKLTPQGEYLMQAGGDYIQRGEAIRRELDLLRTDRNFITIGTSTNNKVRLLYDLWVLFSERSKPYEFRMRLISDEYRCVPDADVVEGIRPNDLWSSSMEFLKICDMPIGCAVDRHHPLASRKLLTYDDLKPYTVVTFSRGRPLELQRLHNDLTAHGIVFDSVDDLDPTVLLRAAFDRRVLQVPMCWQDTMPDLVVIPCEWSYSLDYGIFYRRNPSEPVRALVRFVRGVYDGSIDCGVIPGF